MNKLLVLLIFICTVSKLHSQNEWNWQNPLPQGNSLFDVQFVNQNTAYTVGGASVLLKSTDSGATWNISEYTGGSEKILRSLYFLNENAGWTGGYDGKLLHTTNAGGEWDSVTGQSVQIIRGISFPNPSLGVIVTSYQNTSCCGSIWQTTDGGTTWTNRPLPTGGDSNLADVAFANDTLGMAVGLFGIILRTTDSGSSWQLIDGGTSENLNSIDHIGDNVWMIAGNGRIIIKSTDAGVSWTESYHGITGAFQGIDMVDENTAYVCGYYGEIQKTTNGGQNWSTQQSSTGNQLYGISFSDANTGIAVGAFGTIVRTSNGGTSWDAVSHGTVNDLRAVDFADNQTGFACGDAGTILKTSDSGEVWEPSNNGASETLYGLSFTGPGTGTAVGDYGVILRTTNGGQSWMQQQSGITNPGRLTSVSFVNENTGFAAGYNSSSEAAIKKTTNGGQTWTDSPPGITHLLYSVDFINESHGIVAGGFGSIIYTTDSGVSWNDRSLGFGYTFSSVQMVNDSFAVIAGYSFQSYPPSGVFYFSTDGGNSWTQRSGGIAEIPVTVRFLNENQGIASATYGKILRTTDGGLSWFNEASGTDNSLYGAALTDDGRAFIVGGGGTILASNGIIPVNISGFTADAAGNNILLKWITASETNNKGFEVERREISGKKLWDIIGFVNGSGTTTRSQSYSYNDMNLKPGVYQYRLKQVDFNGNKNYSGAVEIEISAPLEFSLNQNYPNPFNPSTTISFTIPRSNTFTTLKIYNSLGEEIHVLVNRVLSAGNHTVQFNAEGLPNGVYIYELSAGSYNESMKMILLK